MGSSRLNFHEPSMQVGGVSGFQGEDALEFPIKSASKFKSTSVAVFIEGC
jgi:hypothetical protein